MKKTCLLALFSLTVPCGSFPFIYEGIILKRWQPATKSFHYFVGLSDFHDRQHEANLQQRACIQALLQKLDKKNTKLLVEDLCTPPDNYSNNFCKSFRINASGGILGGLSKQCLNQGFLVENVEYRYCRVAALGPLLTQTYQKLDDCPSACKLLVRDIAQEVDQAMNNVTCPVYLAYLLKTLQNIRQKIFVSLKELNINLDSPDSISTYVESHSNRVNRCALVERLLTFDADLLDIKLVSSILTEPKSETVIAFAGGSHIARVTAMLIALGYKKAYTLSAPSRKRQKVSICIGIPTTKTSSHFKPEPINLKIFQQQLYQILQKKSRAACLQR